MSEETLWTRAYGDEYWADVTSPLFFSLVGEYLTEYVNHEGARIMGYREEAWQGSTRISGWWYGGYLGAHPHKTENYYDDGSNFIVRTEVFYRSITQL